MFVLAHVRVDLEQMLHHDLHLEHPEGSYFDGRKQFYERGEEGGFFNNLGSNPFDTEIGKI
jgi:hypothetical protein